MTVGSFDTTTEVPVTVTLKDSRVTDVTIYRIKQARDPQTHEPMDQDIELTDGILTVPDDYYAAPGEFSRIFRVHVKVAGDMKTKWYTVQLWVEATGEEEAVEEEDEGNNDVPVQTAG